MLFGYRVYSSGLLIFLLTLLIFSSGCSGIWTPYFSVNELKQGFFDLATALAVLMITIQGVRWILSDQPEERDECKKAVIYVMLALIAAASAEVIVNALYCSTCGGCCT